MMVDPIANFGDWGAFLEGLENEDVVRFALIGVGIAVSLFGVFWGRRTIAVFLPDDDAARMKTTKVLCWAPYFVGSTIFVISATLNPGGSVYIATVAAATFGGTAWLAWFLPFMVKVGVGKPQYVTRSTSWLAAGVVAAAFTVFVLGPSIVF